MPLQQTSGNVTADAYGGGAAAVTNYIEDVFSTYLYTGNGSTQTITNGIDLAGNGGMVWGKARSTVEGHSLNDTVRGVNKSICSNNNSAQGASDITAFTSSGFSLGYITGNINGPGQTEVSWTFRKQPKFFDVVTYTGTGANRTIAHALGSTPGCIIVKRTDTTSDWQVYHSGLTSAAYSIQLNLTNAQASATTVWNSTAPTSTVFSVGTDATVNASGGTYVAYIFAHNAGGFGLTGTDNVISCGSYTGNGSSTGPVVTLGYEPQWLLVKEAIGGGGDDRWYLLDTMRGFTASNTGTYFLYPNYSYAEEGGTSPFISPTATGFNVNSASGSINQSGVGYIYIAIRRGPMKVPTSGTSVFGLNARTGTGANATVTGSAGVSDAVLIKNRGSAVGDLFASRLTGTRYLETSSTAAEVAAGTTILQANPWDVMDGVKVGTTSTITNASSNTYINYLFRRAPGFFDEVCYTGTGSATTKSHNLGVVPELMIVKSRSQVNSWAVYLGGPLGGTKTANLDKTYAAYDSSGHWNSTQPTASVFSIGNNGEVNDSGVTYVAYLFATCAGVSKVGSYTGNGTTQTINCGFTGGARFVLIKRTDSTGDWYVYDTARGMTTLTDPYLLLNSTAAESATLGSVTSVTTGFAVNASILAAINTNGASYIYLSIA